MPSANRVTTLDRRPHARAHAAATTAMAAADRGLVKVSPAPAAHTPAAGASKRRSGGDRVEGEVTESRAATARRSESGRSPPPAGAGRPR
jgi:hypothetical protein